jgi:hypothetical protein
MGSPLAIGICSRAHVINMISVWCPVTQSQIIAVRKKILNVEKIRHSIVLLAAKNNTLGKAALTEDKPRK